MSQRATTAVKYLNLLVKNLTFLRFPGRLKSMDACSDLTADLTSRETVSSLDVYFFTQKLRPKYRSHLNERYIK